jgi:transposase
VDFAMLGNGLEDAFQAARPSCGAIAYIAHDGEPGGSERVLVTAMEEAHVSRLICVTGFGAGDSRGHGGFRRVRPSKRILGDKAYYSAELREDLQERGTKPVIPNRCNRKQPFSFSKRIYKLRWRIESAFNRLKDFRRIATRYDRLARNYLASVCLVAALVWWI